MTIKFFFTFIDSFNIDKLATMRKMISWNVT